MHRFKDAEGREWSLAINISQKRAVQNRLNVDLSKLFENQFQPYIELMGDLAKFADVLFVLCEKEAITAGIDDYQFGSRLDGPALESAFEAFREELFNFFPDARFRDGLKAIHRKSEEIKNAALQKGMTALDNVEITKAIEDLISRN